MNIRNATLQDTDKIRHIHLAAFDASEAQLVADLAENLLMENSPVNIISLLAVKDNEIVGHTAFSPVYALKTGQHMGYILAPLAVLPDFQNQEIGSSLIKHGLDEISSSGSHFVFVYGDPNYYSRFGFNVDLAKQFLPAYNLEFPHGWQAMSLNAVEVTEAVSISCVAALNNPDLW